MFRKPLLIWQLTNRGFCSEINLLLFAILFSKEHQLDFKIYSKGWNSTFRSGWTDYFLPFTEEISHDYTIKNYLFVKAKFLSVRKLLQKIYLFAITRRICLFNYEIFSKIWNNDFVNSQFSLSGEGIKYDCYSACRNILDKIWRFNDQTDEYIEGSRFKLGLNKEPYFSIHIRRGDKSIEAKPVEVIEYIKKAKSINATINNCFLMTDNYNVVEEVKLLCPEWKVFTLCVPNRKGHEQNEFNARSSESRRDETLQLLAELEIAKGGLFFVGTYTSNIARFVALLRGKETTYSVDIDFKMRY